MIDAFCGDRGLTDCSRQKMRLDDVTSYEQIRMILNAVEAVSIDQPATIIEALETGQVTCLADRRDNQVAFKLFFRAFLADRLA